MHQTASYWVCILQCFLLVTLQVRCIPDTDGVNSPSGEHIQAPDDLVEAERHALTATDNHKLGIEEYLQPSKHLIPFDKNHFDFNDEDWSVYVLPQTKGEQMIVSISPHIEKELRISTIIKPMSNIIITYQIHLTGAPVTPPTFSVYLMTDGIKTLLKEETPQELWKTTSLHIHTKKLDSDLLFVGTLNAHGNKIALRGFTVEDGGGSLILHRYGALPKLPEAEDLLTGSDSHGDSFFSENEPVFHSEGLAHGLGKSYIHPNATSSIDDDSMHLTGSAPQTTTSSTGYSDGLLDNSSYSSYNESSLSGSDYSDFENGNVEESIYGENITDHQFPSDVTDSNNSLSSTSISDPQFIINSSAVAEASNNSNLTDSETTEESATDGASSIAKGVLNFFIVVIICSIVLIGYLFWRRRQNQKEDEIPVFSRAATEHGNPTFTDNEINADVGINRENQLNYRSIE